MTSIVIPENGQLNEKIVGTIHENMTRFFMEIFDHAWLKKSDVQYFGDEKRVIVKLRRHGPNSKGRRKWFGLKVWNNSFAPDIQCKLEINNVLDYKVNDEDPDNYSREEVIIGLKITNTEVYVGSYSYHENPFDVKIAVEKPSILIHDLE